jgi:hypothetical protein
MSYTQRTRDSLAHVELYHAVSVDETTGGAPAGFRRASAPLRWKRQQLTVVSPCVGHTAIDAQAAVLQGRSLRRGRV